MLFYQQLLAWVLIPIGSDQSATEYASLFRQVTSGSLPPRGNVIGPEDSPVVVLF